MFKADMGPSKNGNPAEFSYKLTGDKGSQLLKMQWKNFGLEKGGNDEYINLQVWLYEATGLLEIHFGPSNVNSASYPTGKGPVVGMLEMTPQFSQIYQEMYLVGEASAPTATTGSIDFLNGTPENGAVYRFGTQASSIEALSVADITCNIYPNPAHDRLNISFAEAAPIQSIELLNMQGQSYLQKRYGTQAMLSQESIDISGLPTGMYLLRIYTASGSYTARVLKQ